MKNVSNYKDSLSLKTVEELVEIILRKDDKEREKNKLIHALESKINGLKGIITTNDQVIKDKTEDIRELKTKVLRLTTERDNLETSYDFCRKQNSVLHLRIIILGVIVIIESLMLIFL